MKKEIKRERNAGYSGKMKEIINEWVFVERETTIQYLFDMYALALSDEELLGDKALTKEEIKKVMIAAGTAYNYYHEALDGTPESDYWQDKLDKCLQDIFQELFEPFNTRYPYIKRKGYHR